MSPLRIMTYNVRYFSHGTRGLAATGGPMQSIAEAIAALDPLPDIVCLQEVETSSLRANLAHPRETPEDTQLSRLMRHLDSAIARTGRTDGYAAHYFPAHTYSLTRSTALYTTGLAVLAHRDFTIDHHNAERPADITHRRIGAVRNLKQTRISAHVRFVHRNGQAIDVFNTHLSLPATWTPRFWLSRERMGYGENQLVEARNLIDFIDTERTSDRFIVVGDFNALPGSDVYRFLTEERRLGDPFRMIFGGSDRDARGWPTAGFMNLRMRLDHIFTGPGFEWLDFDDSHPFGRLGARYHGLSDHVPLIARCRVR